MGSDVAGKKLVTTLVNSLWYIDGCTHVLTKQGANCRISFRRLQDIISLKYLNIERGRLKHST